MGNGCQRPILASPTYHAQFALEYYLSQNILEFCFYELLLRDGEVHADIYVSSTDPTGFLLGLWSKPGYLSDKLANPKGIWKFRT